MADEAGSTEENAGDARSVKDRMREDWNRRAAENAEFYIASGSADSDEHFRDSGRQELEGAVLDVVDLRPSARALEIGCGIGRLLVPLSERVREAHGVDISDVMIEKSRVFCAARPNVTTRVTQGTLAGFDDGSLDFVFSFIVFQHVPDRETIRVYLAESARVLAPGGFLRFQVDGRWNRKSLEPGTYDGVKLSSDDVHELIAPTGLEIVDEWGQETHYHWVTARKPGSSPHVRFSPREWNEKELRGMLARTGVERVWRTARDVRRGALSLRRALAGAETRLEKSGDEDFVRTIYRRVWGFEPSADVVSRQAALLAAYVEFREDVLDILLLSAELRDFVRPHGLPEIPWDRLERLERAGMIRSARSRPHRVLRATTRRLSAVPPEELVGLAFRSILGRPPDESTGAAGAGAASDRVPRLLAHRLLALKAPRSVPEPPPSARLEELRSRVGRVWRRPRTGESFPGEAAIGARVLSRTRGLPARDFIGRAYELILGRAPDEDGAAWYAGKLESGSLDRVGLVHELLWSDELRRA